MRTGARKCSAGVRNEAPLFDRQTIIKMSYRSLLIVSYLSRKVQHRFKLKYLTSGNSTCRLTSNKPYLLNFTLYTIWNIEVSERVKKK